MNMQIGHIKYLLFILIEIFLFVIIILLGIKILDIRKEKIKGVYVTKINKDDVIFSSDSSHLKYFYEPKADSVEKSNPDWLGYEVKNTINADSLNERYDYSIEKSPNTYRIITLGDSFTFGQYVNTPENYSEVLEDILNRKFNCGGINKFEVINLGVWGYDINYAVERFKKRGIKYNPNLVIWLINNWNFGKINDYILPIKNRLKKEGIPDFDPISRTYPNSTKAYQEIEQTYGTDIFIKYNRKVLLNVQNIYNNRLLVVSFTGIDQKYKALIHEFVKFNSNYTFFDELTDTFNNDLYNLLDRHPNKLGHEKIADDLFGYLLKNYLQECIVIK